MRSLLLASLSAALLAACSTVLTPDGPTTSSSATTTSSSTGGTGGSPSTTGCGLSPPATTGSGGEGGSPTSGGAPFVTQWAKGFLNGGGLPKIAVDGTGSPVVVGSFGSTLDLGAGVTLTSTEGSGFLARFSHNGVALWAVPVSSFASTVVTDQATAIWVLDDESSPRVSRFDLQGNLLWARTLEHVEYLHVAPAGDGGAFLAGSVFDAFQYGSASLPAPGPGPGGEGAFVLRVDAAGNPLWILPVGSLLWSTPASESDIRHLRVFDIAAAPGGGVVLGVTAQEMLSQPAPGCDGEASLLARIDAQGKPIWSRVLPPIDFEAALAVDAAGDVLIEENLGHGESSDLGHGSLHGPGIGLAMFDPGGNPRWGKWFPSDAGEAKPVFDAAGDIVLAGAVFGSIDFGGGPVGTGGNAEGRIFLAKLSPHGAHLASLVFDALPEPDAGVLYDDDRGESVAVDGSGTVFLLGTYRGALDLGTGPLPVSNDSYGMLIARVSQ
jgi:hypothetical protein